ncbi:MAG: hypothetical protein IPM81_02140 [Saprospirales bacterium]|nr:hypothetical protein [Saprospirales bacterium]
MYINDDLFADTLLGEVLHLKVSGFTTRAETSLHPGGKGKKDRCSICRTRPGKWYEYLDVYQPIEWLLFEGTSGGKYGERSVQAIFSRKRKSKINPAATVHTRLSQFRHPLIGKGVDLRYIQEPWAMKAVRRLRFAHYLPKGMGQNKAR